MSKDTGEHSSYMNLIKKQAGKFPGPGTYYKEKSWKDEKVKGVTEFSKVDRMGKTKVGDGRHVIYENKDVSTGVAMSGKDNLSHIKRVKFGKMGTGKKRSFLDKATAQAGTLPGVGHYPTKAHL